MPTPNETLTTIPENINELIRPSRLQLACPPEENPTFSHSTSAISSQIRRQQPAAATAHQQDIIMSQPQLSPTNMSDDEAATAAASAPTTTTTTTVMKQQGDMERDLQSEPSPSLERKHMDHPQAAASHGLPISPESPFTPSLSYEFSSKRVSGFFFLPPTNFHFHFLSVFISGISLCTTTPLCMVYVYSGAILPPEMGRYFFLQRMRRKKKKTSHLF